MRGVVQPERQTDMTQFAITLLKRFRRQDLGATAIEYGLIAGIIAIGIIIGLTAVEGELAQIFTDIAGHFQTILAG